VRWVVRPVAKQPTSRLRLDLFFLQGTLRPYHHTLSNAYPSPPLLRHSGLLPGPPPAATPRAINSHPRPIARVCERPITPSPELAQKDEQQHIPRPRAANAQHRLALSLAAISDLDVRINILPSAQPPPYRAGKGAVQGSGNSSQEMFSSDRLTDDRSR